MKKVNFYLILGIVAFIALIIFILFSFGIIKPTSSTKTTFNRLNVGEKVFFPHLSRDGSFLYYFGDQGTRLKKFELSGKTEILYPSDILYIQDIHWSPDESKIIIKNYRPYAETPTQLLDFKTHQPVNLNKNIQNVIWSNDSQRIYYQYFDRENNLNYLASANYDGTKEEKIINLESPEYNFMWLDNADKIAFWPAPSDLSGTKLQQIDLQTRNTSEIFSDFRLNKAISSPDGQYFIYSRYLPDNNILALSYAKSDGTNNKDLEFFSPLQKVAWSNDGSFFIVASREKETENDKFYKIETKNGKITMLNYKTSKNQDIISAENPMLSPDNKTLYFTSNDILYSLNLE